MNYITIPYYYDYHDSHLLPIEWSIIDAKLKCFTYHDRLVTIQMHYSKNNCKVFIHNNVYHFIDSITTSTIRDAINFIDYTLAEIVNHYLLKDAFDISYLHDCHLYSIFYN